MIKKTMMMFIAFALFFSLAACGRGREMGKSGNELPNTTTDLVDDNSMSSSYVLETSEIMNKSIVFKINDIILDVFWLDNQSVKCLKELAKEGLTIQMNPYGGFEQVGSLGQTIPPNDERITTAAGDICLYQSNQLVVFYGSNTWEYTKLGHISMGKSELTDLLSDENVVVTIILD